MSGEKKHKPTAKKMEDARKKGQVAVSKDAGIIIKLAAFYMLFFWMGHLFTEHFSELVGNIVKHGLRPGVGFSESLVDQAFELLMLATLPVALVCAVAGLVSTVAQVGLRASPEAATPSFKKMDAVGNIKNMFSKKSLVQLLLSVVKVLVLGMVAYLVFAGSVSEILYSFRAGLDQLFILLMDILQRVVIFTLAVFVVLSLIDWVMERNNLIKNLRMSDQDLRDEYKQSEGDPHLKGKRKQMHQSLLNASLSRVSGAKAVVANPTHISVALDYEPGKHDLPYIVAMGVDEDALAIRETAKKHGVPVIVNVKLARMIYQDCEEDEYIQKQHLELAAEVFKAVMALGKTTR
ncbi:MAG TPA: EscU/YscU/HrcU family type III secretion system export apparatus switch protein [Limnobacter sp.]|nr:EscU/YscU/HrcU family type III secretion system export apparatus switch protein [Limnobacter sp.]